MPRTQQLSLRITASHDKLLNGRVAALRGLELRAVDSGEGYRSGGRVRRLLGHVVLNHHQDWLDFLNVGLAVLQAVEVRVVVGLVLAEVGDHLGKALVRQRLAGAAVAVTTQELHRWVQGGQGAAALVVQRLQKKQNGSAQKIKQHASVAVA